MKKSVILLLVLFSIAFVSAEFTVDSVLIKNSIKDSGMSYVKIVNGDDAGDFLLSISGIENARLSEESFSLEAKEERVVKINFSGFSPGFYSGFLNVNEKEIPVLVESESEQALFDAQISMPNKKIFPGNEVLVEIKIYDLYRIGVSDVEVEFSAKDFEGNEIYFDKETVVVKDSANLMKTLKLPPKLPAGEYYFSVIVGYKDSVGVATEYFPVLSNNQEYVSFFISNSVFIGMGVLVLFLIAIIFVYIKVDRRRLRNVVHRQKEEIREIGKAVKTKINNDEKCKICDRLEKQKQMLERAKDSGFISKDAYNKGMKRLSLMIKKVGKRK